MPRVATYMTLKQGMENRYRQEHENIWPEVVEGILRFGIRNYTIFMQGRELISYFEVDNLERAMAAAAADPDNQRWQAHMAEYFDQGPGIRDQSTVRPEEVFYTAGYQGQLETEQRVGTLMSLKEGRQAEYRERHDRIWPEILSGIARVKIRNYSIFLIGRTLFSYFEVEDLDTAMQSLAADPDNQRWQEYMGDFFEVGPGIDSGTTVYLEEIFHVD